MDKILAVFKICGPVQYNPACFDFSEEEAREKKLWTDPKPMPTQKELEAAWKEVQKELYKEKRQEEYLKEGLSFNHFVELLIENDSNAIAEFRAKRDEIKEKIPKP